MYKSDESDLTCKHDKTPPEIIEISSDEEKQYKSDDFSIIAEAKASQATKNPEPNTENQVLASIEKAAVSQVTAIHNTKESYTQKQVPAPTPSKIHQLPDNKQSTQASQSRKKLQKSSLPSTTLNNLQAGIALNEDIELEIRQHPSFSLHLTCSSYIQDQQWRTEAGLTPLLYHDETFECVPASIRGAHKDSSSTKCRCSPPQLAKLTFSRKPGPNWDQPFYCCARRRCNYFTWAYKAEQLQWYRFGQHNQHMLVGPQGFTAADLVQGKVGDCWFLSALAVVAERPDLIRRLFPSDPLLYENQYGIVQVHLFVDGFWKAITIDNFLPCILDSKVQEDGGHSEVATTTAFSSPSDLLSLSRYDPFALSDKNLNILQETHKFLNQRRHQVLGQRSNPSSEHDSNIIPRFTRPITSDDLAYSKAHYQQLWVPFLEKAYAKSHGSYQAISGGHIAEAFLDLTGAPSLQIELMTPHFDPRHFWFQLLSWRAQRLPMGCGTDRSAAGILGMHAYSILDVQEIREVALHFFAEQIETGVLGNVSGFTEMDGTVRLLKIRNPHGQGEWQGDFSDRSIAWDQLLACVKDKQQLDKLHRSMANDGTFWISYDHFLMGFSNVDVVLAFAGNHAKSFSSNFPPKKSNHRCHRAFEVSLLEPQTRNDTRDTVKLYVMGIQKSRRGAAHGRVDRKKSYKLSDLGILVGEYYNDRDALEEKDHSGQELQDFDAVQGQMFGFSRNGHYSLILNRTKNRRLVIMPVSFGHPAATDQDFSFVLRFVSDAPLLIRELSQVPRMDIVLRDYIIQARWSPQTKQGQKTILYEHPGALFKIVQMDCLGMGGGTVFLYLFANKEKISNASTSIDVSIQVTCRGMACRTETGLLEHETVAKRKKFEASWRKYSNTFFNIRTSRLLMVLAQSGQDTQMGQVACQTTCGNKLGSIENIGIKGFVPEQERSTRKHCVDDYENLGIFNWTYCNDIHSTFQGIAHGGQNSFHSKLDQTLAISASDLDLQRVIEMSKMVIEPAFIGSKEEKFPNGDDSDVDLDLQRAIEMSKNDIEPAFAESKLRKFSNRDEIDVDLDLQRVIELSKADMDRGAGSSTTITDMSYESQMKRAIEFSLRDRFQVLPITGEVLEVHDISSGNEKGSIDSTRKTDKVLKVEESTKIQNISISSHVQKDIEFPTAKKAKVVESASKPSLPVESQEEKRKRAAEAAMRRLQAHQERV